MFDSILDFILVLNSENNVSYQANLVKIFLKPIKTGLGFNQLG